MASLDLIQGRYRILQELGRGGMSIVYLARDEHLHHRPVVVKVLKEASAEDWIIKKFKQEIEALARIHHPGVVGILDAGEISGGRLFVVMQFVEGINLRAILNQQRGAIAFGLAARIFYQIGHALSAAHGKGVLHCDLKPENIMVQTSYPGEETVKLIDFGIAKIRDSKVHSPATTQVAGTVQYMAPEQLEGTTSTATDVFALGVIAFEILTGQVPFAARNILELFTMHRDGLKQRPKELRPNLPDSAEAAILKALSRNPAERYSSVMDFTNELARALKANEGASPVFTTASWPAVNWSKKILLILSALLILISIAGIIRETAQKNPGRTETKNLLPAATGELNLQYWMMVQNHRDGAIYEEPFRLAKEINFEAGDRIQMNIRAQQSGYLYILNEGPERQEQRAQYVVLFPSTLANHGSARVIKDQEVQVPGRGWFIFDRERGTEKVWIVFSTEPLPVLESVKALANPAEKGVIKEPFQIDAVATLLKESGVALVEEKREDQLTVLKGRGKRLVHLVLLEHH